MAADLAALAKHTDHLPIRCLLIVLWSLLGGLLRQCDSVVREGTTSAGQRVKLIL
jgi:hypothetical protein